MNHEWIPGVQSYAWPGHMGSNGREFCNESWQDHIIKMSDAGRQQGQVSKYVAER